FPRSVEKAGRLASLRKGMDAKSDHLHYQKPEFVKVEQMVLCGPVPQDHMVRKNRRKWTKSQK
ncbi:hypothetical protein OFB83_28085, partial [Escherichia coli]|nr:hypothetical protein [Escherichia coli]